VNRQSGRQHALNLHVSSSPLIRAARFRTRDMIARIDHSSRANSNASAQPSGTLRPPRRSGGSATTSGGARQLIVGDYAKAAREIAETLARAHLPAYTGYIQIEAFRGHGATLGQTVVLPAISPAMRSFGQRDLDTIRSTSFRGGTDCAEGPRAAIIGSDVSRPRSFGPNRERRARARLT
jgi:hypothetical protein